MKLVGALSRWWLRCALHHAETRLYISLPFFVSFIANIARKRPELKRDKTIHSKFPDCSALTGSYEQTFRWDHFTPTSASWLNLVERSFAEITSRRIRRGSYSSVDDLEAAIYDYLAHHNESPKPFKWTKTAKDILTRERRALDKIDEIRGNR